MYTLTWEMLCGYLTHLQLGQGNEVVLSKRTSYSCKLSRWYSDKYRVLGARVFRRRLYPIPGKGLRGVPYVHNR